MTDVDPTSLSDKELLAIRSAWEAERAPLWQHVVQHKGLDYQREYDGFMARKAEAEAATAELRRRGLLRRGRPPRGAGTTEAAPARPRLTDFSSAFVFEHSARRVRAAADAHVRFEEKDRLALRAALRAATGRLRIDDTEVLRCAFLGPKPTVGTDVENLVLYNLGLGSDVLARGVAFEHLNEPPADGAIGYEYAPVSAAAPLRLWRAGTELIRWSDVDLPAYSAPGTWWTLRRAGVPLQAGDLEADILVRCRLATPRTLGVGEIKAVVDGVIAAAQWMPDVPAERVELLASILERGLAIKPDIHEVAAALAADERSVLGACPGLIPSDGRINPDDHRLVAGVLLLEPSNDPAPRIIDAAIHLAERRLDEHS